MSCNAAARRIKHQVDGCGQVRALKADGRELRLELGQLAQLGQQIQISVSLAMRMRASCDAIERVQDKRINDYLLDRNSAEQTIIKG